MATPPAGRVTLLLRELKSGNRTKLGQLLEEVCARQARIVELRYFAGMSVPEVAEAIGIDPPTVDHGRAAARAWLRGRLKTNP